MSISANLYTVGTASVELCAPSVEPQRVTVQNLQPQQTPGALSRDGYVYEVAQSFTLAGNGTATFSMLTGNHGAQFEYYTMVSSQTDVLAELIEGASITTTGTAIPAYNLNRNASDSHDAVLEGATSATGGTVVGSEFVSASIFSAGAMSMSKIHTLEPNTQYAFRFTSQGGLSTDVYFQLGFSEQYNGGHDVWLNASAGSAYCLQPGEVLHTLLHPGESLTGVTDGQNCQVSVLRQDQN